jgi:DUF4097 and DUF4098 domain-containing protein YvlB
MRLIQLTSFVALGTLGAALAAAPAARADQWSKTYQLSGRADLHVTTNDGDVNIVSSDQNQLTAHVTTTGSYKLGPDDVNIEENQSGNRIEITVKRRNWHVFFSHGGINVTVNVPRDLDLDVRTGDGNVDLKPVAGHIKIDTGDGNVTADGAHGDMHMHSGDGRIVGTNLDGSLDVNTGDGRISVRGRFDILNLKTGDGSIEAEAASGSKVASTWTLHTGDGHINLRVPSDLSADLDAHTGDGHITLDFPVAVSGSLSHSSIHGKLNGGGAPLNISSGDGSIRIEKL